MSTQNGTVALPASDQNSLDLTCCFPIPYNGTSPLVTVKVQGSSGNYTVQGIIPSPLAFRFTVTRTDQPGGWTEQPELEWNAEGREVPPARGNQTIAASSTNTANVSVQFPSAIDPAPEDIFAWVNGNFANQITYAVQMGSINSGGFQCTVQRTDATNGWDQRPILYWTIIQP
ncbi:uncharacterized protein LOC143469183 [Clavelina lepadiformis]|uniref:uncharacterized protein LOC143469183 n=1 Tax=Clavelina lepadiformis TaxID=159417 RepID=UPI0040428A92